MRKVLLLATLLFITACGNSELKTTDEPKTNEISVHESISEDLAIDSAQVLSVIEGAIENDEQLDMKVLDRYLEVYDEQFLNMNDADSGLYALTSMVANQAESFTQLESSKENFKTFQESIIYYIENGEKQPE